MTEEELAAIEARAAAALKGPWEGGYIEDQPGERYLVIGGQGLLFCRIPDVRPDFRSSAVFMIHAREDVPALIAEIRRLQGRLAEKDDDEGS